MAVTRLPVTAGYAVTGYGAGAVTRNRKPVHFVEPEFDARLIIMQKRAPVLPGDDAESLAARVLELERRIYPAALVEIATELRARG
jgi:folate-dependent phosphoribosylglycinamide formyltransferase PurN